MGSGFLTWFGTGLRESLRFRGYQLNSWRSRLEKRLARKNMMHLGIPKDGGGGFKYKPFGLKMSGLGVYRLVRLLLFRVECAAAKWHVHSVEPQKFGLRSASAPRNLCRSCVLATPQPRRAFFRAEGSCNREIPKLNSQAP